MLGINASSPSVSPHLSKLVLLQLGSEQTASLILCIPKIGKTKQLRMFWCGNCNLVMLFEHPKPSRESQQGCLTWLLGFSTLCGVFSISGWRQALVVREIAVHAGRGGDVSLLPVIQTALILGYLLIQGLGHHPLNVFAVAGQRIWSQAAFKCQMMQSLKCSVRYSGLKSI